VSKIPESRLKARKVLARNLRALRGEMGWSQEELARRVGLHRTYVGAVERAERNISIDNIERLARVLKVEIGELFNNNPIWGVK